MDDKYECIVSCITENQERYYRLAYSYVKDRDSALDVVQNSVLRALQNCHKLNESAAVKIWLYRIVVNESIRYIGKNKREMPSEAPEGIESVYTERAYDRDDTVYKAVSKLPEEMRTVIVLRYFEELSLKEIAEITDTNLNTVKTRLYSSHRRLRKFLEEEGYEI